MAVAILLVTLVLSGCSALTGMAAQALIPAASDGISADAEVTIGQKKEAINTQLGDSSSLSVESKEVGKIEQGTQKAQVINNNELSPATLILILSLVVIGLLGWMLPRPEEMWTWFRGGGKDA